ncbi:hypothetical protein D9M68_307830 [compost metagenome]
MVTCMPSTMICLAAVAMAIRPEAHWRSRVWPLTEIGRPAASTLMRPRFQPAVPAGIPVPMTRSSISAASMPARSTAARMAKEAMVGAVVALKAPRNALPMGVRAVERMTASFM